MTINTPVKKHYQEGMGYCNYKIIDAEGNSVSLDVIAAALNERAELLAEVERLKESLHKCDGMANEINILTAENRRLTAQVEVLSAAVRELPEAIPTTWLDSLLTGPDAVVNGKREGFDCREIEALLRGIQDRLRARSKSALDEIEAMRRGDAQDEG